MLYLKQSEKVLSYFGELRSPDAGTPFVLYRKRALEGGVQVAKRSVVLPAASPARQCPTCSRHMRACG